MTLITIKALLLLAASFGALPWDSVVAATAQTAAPSPTARPVANGTFPVVSPDGRLIAFTSDRGGVTDVFVIAPDGSGEQRVTGTPEAEGNLAWTADGKRILFSTFKEDRSHLFAIDPSGQNQTELATVPGRAPTLSPDGKQMVSMAGTWTSTILTLSAPDGSRPRPITDGSSVAWNSRWSPDGKLLAFTGRDSPKAELAVFVMNADGSSRRQVTHVPSEEGGAQVPAWSKDGTWLAVQVNSRTQKNEAHIWIVEVATGAARKLSTHTEPYLDETPSWFPDGKRVAFQSDRTGRMEIWVMNLDGTQARQVTGTR